MAMSVREAFDKGTEAFNSHDIDAFGDTMSEDIVHIAPGGMRMEGKEACKAYFAGWIEAFPDAHVDVHDLVITDDAVIEEGTFSGTHNGVLHGPMGDIAATGRSVTAQYIQVLRFRDGLCVSGNLMFDQVELLGQLGLLPAPAATT